MKPERYKLKRTNNKYIILWKNNARIASSKLVNKEEILKNLNYMLIQIDICGNEHYEVISIRKEKK